MRLQATDMLASIVLAMTVNVPIDAYYIKYYRWDDKLYRSLTKITHYMEYYLSRSREI